MSLSYSSQTAGFIDLDVSIESLEALFNPGDLGAGDIRCQHCSSQHCIWNLCVASRAHHMHCHKLESMLSACCDCSRDSLQQGMPVAVSINLDQQSNISHLDY